MTPALTPVPTLDEISRDPSRAASLPAEAARALLARCVLVQSALLAPALAASAVAPPVTVPAVEEWVTLEEAAKILGVHPRWFSRRRGKLSFVKKLSPRTIVVSKQGLHRWIAAKTA